LNGIVSAHRRNPMNAGMMPLPPTRLTLEAHVFSWLTALADQ
jgi:hypothetical protein